MRSPSSSSRTRHEVGLGAAVAGLKAGFKAEIAALETRLTWRLLGGVTVIVGLAVALIKLG